MRPNYTIDRDTTAVYLSTNNTIGVSLTAIICHAAIAEDRSESYSHAGTVSGFTLNPTDASSLLYFGGRRFIRANGAIRYRKLWEFGFTADDVMTEFVRNRTKLVTTLAGQEARQRCTLLLDKAYRKLAAFALPCVFDHSSGAVEL